MTVKELKETLNDVRIDENWIVEIGIVPYSSKNALATKWSDALRLVSLNWGSNKLRFDLYLQKQ
jgi:hypothetical protein